MREDVLEVAAKGPTVLGQRRVAGCDQVVTGAVRHRFQVSREQRSDIRIGENDEDRQRGGGERGYHKEPASQQDQEGDQLEERERDRQPGQAEGDRAEQQGKGRPTGHGPRQ